MLCCNSYLGKDVSESAVAPAWLRASSFITCSRLKTQIIQCLTVFTHSTLSHRKDFGFNAQQEEDSEFNPEAELSQFLNQRDDVNS